MQVPEIWHVAWNLMAVIGCLSTALVVVIGGIAVLTNRHKRKQFHSRFNPQILR